MKFVPVFFILFSLKVASQRVEFNDPDLTFSFVKPSEWIMHDGPTVFVMPKDESSSDPITFFSITYFENPVQTDTSDIVFDAGEIEASIPPGLIEINSSVVGRIYIAGESALWASYFHTKNGIRVKAVSYVFMKMGQRFEISVSAPKSEFENFKPLFDDLLHSISINKN